MLGWYHRKKVKDHIEDIFQAYIKSQKKELKAALKTYKNTD